MSSNVCFTRLFLKSASYSSCAKHEVYMLKYVKLGQFDFFMTAKSFQMDQKRPLQFKRGRQGVYPVYVKVFRNKMM